MGSSSMPKLTIALLQSYSEAALRNADELLGEASLLHDHGHSPRTYFLRGLTPYEHVVKCWAEEPDRFKVDPRHHIPGPDTKPCAPWLGANGVGVVALVGDHARSRRSGRR